MEPLLLTRSSWQLQRYEYGCAYTHTLAHECTIAGRRVIEGGSSGHEDDEWKCCAHEARAQCSEEKHPLIFFGGGGGGGDDDESVTHQLGRLVVGKVLASTVVPLGAAASELQGAA